MATKTKTDDVAMFKGLPYPVRATLAGMIGEEDWRNREAWGEDVDDAMNSPLESTVSPDQRRFVRDIMRDEARAWALVDALGFADGPYDINFWRERTTDQWYVVEEHCGIVTGVDGPFDSQPDELGGSFEGVNEQTAQFDSQRERFEVVLEDAA